MRLEQTYNVFTTMLPDVQRKKGDKSFFRKKIRRKILLFRLKKGGEDFVSIRDRDPAQVTLDIETVGMLGFFINNNKRRKS